jgi:hypothetical protein
MFEKFMKMTGGKGNSLTCKSKREKIEELLNEDLF